MLRKSLLHLALVPGLIPALISAQPTPLSASRLTVGGTVRSSEGTVVSEATAQLFSLESNFERASKRLAGLADDKPVAEATTDDSGRFSLVAPSEGVWRLVVRSEGRVPMQLAPLPLVQSVELAPVTLQPDVGTVVRALGADARPLGKVWVWAAPSQGSFWRERSSNGWQPGERLGQTGDDGTLRLARAPGERFDVTGTRPGAALSVQVRDVEGTTLELVSPHASSKTEREIVVLGEEGNPLAGVLISFGELAWPVGKTDDDGRFTLRGHLDESLLLHLLTDDGRHSKKVLDLPEKDAEPSARVTLAGARRVRGRILASPLRSPLPRVMIWPGHDPGAFVHTDAEGRYSVVSPAEERFWIQAETAGFLPLATWVQQADIHVRRAPTLTLEPATRLVGLLVDSEGKAVSGVGLKIVPEAPTRRPRALLPDGALSRALSDSEGRFALERLRETGTYLLTAAKEGFETVALAVRTPARELRIVLATARSVFGHVVDLEDRPVAGAAIRLVEAKEEGGLPRLRPTWAYSPDDPYATLTDREGRFELTQIPSPTLDIEAQSEGFSSLRVRGVEVPSKKGPTDLGTLVLAPGAAVEGRVIDSAGAPIAGASVWAAVDEGRPTRVAARSLLEREPDTRTEDDGGFRIDDLKPGQRIVVLVEQPGYLVASVRGVQAPTTEPVSVVLEAAGRVQGTVVEKGGAPVPGARVTLAESEDTAGVVGPWRFNRASATSDQRGEFALDRVASGEVRIEAFAEGYQPPDPIHLSLRPGENVDGLRIELDRGAVIEGRVASDQGEPIENARIAIGRPTANSDAEGSFRVEGIPPGAQEIIVRHPDFNRLEKELEIEPGVNRFELVLEGGWAVSGQAMTDTGEPIDGVVLDLQRVLTLDPGSHHATSESDGGFTVPRVPNGTFTITSQSRDWAPIGPPPTFEVDGAAVQDLEIRLEPSAAVAGRVLGLEFEELAQVRVKAEDGRREKYGKVDYEGAYEITGLGTGDWRLKAWLKGGSRQAEAAVIVERGARRIHRDLEFRGGITVSGVITYAGEPLPDTSVTLVGHDFAARRSVWTDFEGFYQIEDLSRGRFRLDLANSRESLTYNQDLELSGDRELSIDIPTARISGAVVSAADGKPLLDALVGLQHLLGGDGSRRGSLTTVATDLEGRFLIQRLTAGRYRMTVTRNGFAPVERSLEIEASVPVEGLELALQPTEGLDLVVRLASGRAPIQVSLAVFGPRGVRVLTETRVPAADGSVSFPTVPAGDWRLLVSAPGGVPTRFGAAVPGEPAAVTLPDAARLKVRVPVLVESSLNAALTLFGSDGRPFEGVDATGAPKSRWTLIGGVATVDGVPAGQWLLNAVAPDGQTWSGAVTTSAGYETLVSLE